MQASPGTTANLKWNDYVDNLVFYFYSLIYLFILHLFSYIPSLMSFVLDHITYNITERNNVVFIDLSIETICTINKCDSQNKKNG